MIQLTTIIPPLHETCFKLVLKLFFSIFRLGKIEWWSVSFKDAHGEGEGGEEGSDTLIKIQ